MRVLIVVAPSLMEPAILNKTMDEAARRRSIIPTTVVCAPASPAVEWATARGVSMQHPTIPFVELLATCDSVVAIWDGKDEPIASLIRHCRDVDKLLYMKILA